MQILKVKNKIAGKIVGKIVKLMFGFDRIDKAFIEIDMAYKIQQIHIKENFLTF